MADDAARYAEVEAWAKLNLDLRILAREDTGYHQLETIFQRITLADTVKVLVREGSGIVLRCTPGVDVPDDQNLAYRAAVAYRAVAEWPGINRRIAIAIDKKIPTGGGLGGGSANAGAVLRILNALNPDPLDSATLLTIAASLGADVPFLTTESTRVLAWGRGERMLPLPALPRRTVHLATFAQGVNTAHAYGALAEHRAAGRLPRVGSALLDAATLDNWAALQRHARNDFEGPVFAMRPDVAAMHERWSAAAPLALVRMSGSGATVFAITDGRAEALAAALDSTARDVFGIGHVTATTLDSVPPVRILSPPIGFS